MRNIFKFYNNYFVAIYYTIYGIQIRDFYLNFEKLLVVNKYFFIIICFLFLYKQGKSIAISLHFAIIVILVYLNNNILKRMAKVLRTNPGSSKHFFEIFPNKIWESSLNLII